MNTIEIILSDSEKLKWNIFRKLLFFFILFTGFFSGFKIQAQSWKDPGYQPLTYEKILVIAKVSDPVIERPLEDAVVAKLSQKGISSVAQYAVIPHADTLSDDAFNQITDNLHVDGLLVFSFNAPEKAYKAKSSVSIGLGIPFRMGIFGGFLGTSVPLAGGTRVISIVNGNASFYNRSSKDVKWSSPFSDKNDDWSELSKKIARVTVREMLRDGIFLK